MQLRGKWHTEASEEGKIRGVALASKQATYSRLI